MPATLAALAASVGLAVSIAICWPTAQPPFTLNRELGENTVFRTNAYEEACRWARIRTPLYHRGDLGWEISQHTWVGYSALSAGPELLRPLCVTDRGPPAAGYELVFSSPDGAKLYCRDPHLRDWLAAQHPPAGRERFPWVFRLIAREPEPQDAASQAH